MEGTINQIKVVEYIRSNMEPVPMDSIVKQFANVEIDGVDLKMQLEQILRSALSSGQLQHCNNYYYSASLDQDLKDLVDLSALSDMPMDDEGDAISFSSCESNENKTEVSVEQTVNSNEESKTSASDNSNIEDDRLKEKL